MNHPFLSGWAALLATALVMPAEAAELNDASLEGIIDEIFAAEVALGRHQEALDNLLAAKTICDGDACSRKAQAALWIAIATVEANLKQNAAAATSFGKALELNARAQLPDKFPDKSGRAKQLWQAAKKAQQLRSRASCVRSYQAGGPLPRNWQNGEAYHCYLQAKAASQNDQWGECADNARASLAAENQTRPQELLARCLEADNRWSDAIAAYRALSRSAASGRRFKVGREAAQRAARLRRQMPSITLERPEDVTDLVVRIDGDAISPAELDAEIALDPGEHLIRARGQRQGRAVAFIQRILLRPKRSLSLILDLTEGAADPKTAQTLRCLSEGNSFKQCLANSDARESNLEYRVRAEVAGYHDTLDVEVLAPSARVGVEHLGEGWGLHASMLVDIVTAASPDIVATASPRWTEVRLAPAAGAHVGAGSFDFAVRGTMSHEPDYLALGVGGTVSATLNQKMLTPSIGYDYGHDKNGKADTSFDVFALPIDRHALTLGLGIVINAATFASVQAVIVLEDGDASKPYRHVAMFSPAVANEISKMPGLEADAVNLAREPEQPLEQLPDERQRYAAAFSLAHRFTNSTIRLSERLYADSWGTKATTADIRFLYDVTKAWRIWPHGRFHLQSGADFWRRAYALERTSATVVLPTYRAGDRELGPLLSAAAGAGTRLGFGENRRYGITVTGDIAYTSFLNHLYVDERIGYFAALGFDAEFQ